MLFSTGGAAVKSCGMTGWQVACLRSGIAMLVIMLLLPSARRGWSLRTLLVGFAYASTMICYVLSNKLTTAASAIFLQSAAPLYILLLGPWLLGERFGRRQVPFLLILTGGMVLLLVGIQPPTASAPVPLLGNLIGLATGLSWALTIMGLRWLGRDRQHQAGGPAAAVACGNLVACLVCAPLALPVSGASPSDWLLILYLGGFQVALAYVFLTRGVVRVPALETSLLLMVEPVLNPVWAWLVHHETPAVTALLGGAVILTATMVRTWLESRE